MNVSLTPRLENFIKNKIKKGRYQSASEVVRDALRALEDREQDREQRLADLRKEVAIGLNDIKEGRYKTYTDATLKDLIEDVKREGRRRLATRRRSRRR